jgi:hypothetical protein
MNRTEFDRKHPKGTYPAALNAKLGAVVARAGMCMTRAREFNEDRVEYRALMFSAEKLLGHVQKMSDELKSLMDGPPSAAVVVTPEQQAVLDAVEDCIARQTELYEELWEKFWAEFGGEIEGKYIA